MLLVAAEARERQVVVSPVAEVAVFVAAVLLVSAVPRRSEDQLLPRRRMEMLLLVAALRLVLLRLLMLLLLLPLLPRELRQVLGSRVRILREAREVPFIRTDNF